MKIAVTTMKGGLDDDVSSMLGRCSYFTIVEVDGEKITKTEILKNEFAMAGGGVGVRVAQFLGELSVNAVIAGNFGPNAFSILNQAGIKCVQAQGKVKDIVIAFTKGELKELSSESVQTFRK